MRGLVTIGLMIFVCVLGVSCATTPPAEVHYFPVDLVIEAETEVVFEVFLDDELILSNKAVPGTKVAEKFRAQGGKHSLVVSAEGHDKWQRTIGLISDSDQHYFVSLKKAKIHIPTIAR